MDYGFPFEPEDSLVDSIWHPDPGLLALAGYLSHTPHTIGHAAEPPPSGSAIPSKKCRALSPSLQQPRRRKFGDNERAETAKTRKLAACVSCQRSKQRCVPNPHNPDGPCLRCQGLQTSQTQTDVPLIWQPCCRVKLSEIEVFRRGPTLEFAWSRRWQNPREQVYGKHLWKPFSKPMVVSRYGESGALKTLHLSQGWVPTPLVVKVGEYKVKKGDKQHWEWLDGDQRRTYRMPPFSIADPDSTVQAIEDYLEEHLEEYIDSRLQHATQITKGQFEMAKMSNEVRLPTDLFPWRLDELTPMTRSPLYASLSDCGLLAASSKAHGGLRVRSCLGRLPTLIRTVPTTKRCR